MNKRDEIATYAVTILEGSGLKKLLRHSGRQMTAADITVNIVGQLPGCHIPLHECHACRGNIDGAVKNVVALLTLAKEDAADAS